MAYDLTAEERETIITTNDDEEGTWHIYTCQRKIMNMIEKLGFKAHQEEKIDGKVVSKSYKDIPFGNVKIGKIRKMNLTEEQRKERSENMKKIRNES